MLRTGLTPANISSAEAHAEANFRKMLQAMGFPLVSIQFEQTAP